MKSLIFSLVLIFLIMTISTFAQDMPALEKGISHKLAKWRAANYSDVRYKLNLIIKKKSPTLNGTIEVTLNVKKDSRNGIVKERVDTKLGSTSNKNTLPNGRVSAIILDWRKIKGHEELSNISNVSVNGKSAKFEESNEHLIFKDGVKTGENIIKLDFESPILTSGSAITRYIDKEDGAEYIYSLFVPSDASTAFPVFDQPDLKARFKLEMYLPTRSWTAISNTKGEEFIENINGIGGRSTYYGAYFEETKPISTYLFAFAVGEFTEVSEQGRNATAKKSVDAKQDSKITKDTLSNGRVSASKIYVRKSQAEKFKQHSEEIFRLNRESINYFEDYFDYKFPFPKYDLVLIPEFPFGGMEHAGATFLRESSIIFPTEPTANNYISRANLLFHENAHQWFGDTVTMKWFDDLWLKEGFATFMAYKAMEKVLPEYDAWKVFYERTKQRAYLTDVTRGTTPIYQEIPNLNSAKSAYGNIVYQKAPSFLKQAEFYLGEENFQKAIRSFLKLHEFNNAEWSDLVREFEKASIPPMGNMSSLTKTWAIRPWANTWVKKRGLPIIRVKQSSFHSYRNMGQPHDTAYIYSLTQDNALGESSVWLMKTRVYIKLENDQTDIKEVTLKQDKSVPKRGFARYWVDIQSNPNFRPNSPKFIFPNYKDHGYGIFLLDERSKRYVLENIQNEKDDFLRSMMWGSLWDSVRFAELNPKDYVELAIKNIGVETDVSTISSILARVDTAMTYYLSDGQAKELAPKLEKLLIDKMKTAKTQGERITFYRAFLGIASSNDAKKILNDILTSKIGIEGINCESRYCKRINEKPKKSLSVLANDIPIQNTLKTKDKFDIVTRLIILDDKDAPRLLAELEKTETDDAAKRYAYAAKAGFRSAENKAKYWNDFINNKQISESWIEAADGVWNTPEHSDLTLPYLEKALAELPNHKQNRKIFFVNGWVASFIGGQKSERALNIVNKFLKDNPNLDIDLQRKILERLDGLERAVRIRGKYGK